MDLRDHWEKEDCPAQKSIAALKDLLGLPVTIQLEPLILWSELQKFYSDHSTFVPCITTVIKAWLDCLTKRLADDANAAWTEELLEHVNQSGKNLKARVEVRLNATSKCFGFEARSSITWPMLNHGIRHDQGFKSKRSSRKQEQRSLSASPSHRLHTKTYLRAS